MTAHPAETRTITYEEYEALEATSEVKHEYYKGHVFAMSGGTADHSGGGGEAVARCRAPEKVARSTTRSRAMAEHPNIRLIREMMQAFNSSNPGAVLDAFAEDAVLHVPGQSPIAGTYRGKSEIARFFGKMGQLSEGPPRVGVHHVLTGGDEYAVAV